MGKDKKQKSKKTPNFRGRNQYYVDRVGECRESIINIVLSVVFYLVCYSFLFDEYLKTKCNF